MSGYGMCGARRRLVALRQDTHQSQSQFRTRWWPVLATAERNTCLALRCFHLGVEQGVGESAAEETVVEQIVLLEQIEMDSELMITEQDLHALLVDDLGLDVDD